MKKDELIDVVKAFVSENKELDLYLIGTSNLLLQGADVVPKDIDFIVSASTVKVVSNKYGSKVNKNDTGYIETELDYMGNEIHLVSSEGNPLREDDIHNHSTIINLQGYDIRGLSLESEKSFYQKAGREKDKNKVKIIDNLLAL